MYRLYAAHSITTMRTYSAEKSTLLHFCSPVGVLYNPSVNTLEEVLNSYTEGGRLDAKQWANVQNGLLLLLSYMGPDVSVLRPDEKPRSPLHPYHIYQ